MLHIACSSARISGEATIPQSALGETLILRAYVAKRRQTYEFALFWLGNRCKPRVRVAHLHGNSPILMTY